MNRSIPAALAAFLSLASCADSTAEGPVEPATVAFDGAVVGGALDPALADAWEQARTHPENGLAYAFSVRTTGLDEGTRLDLVMARDQGLFVNGVPVTDGDYVVQTTTARADGSATFDPPAVDTGDWSSADHAVPAALLCGETLVMPRALDASGTIVVASTYLLVVTAACP